MRWILRAASLARAINCPARERCAPALLPLEDAWLDSVLSTEESEEYLSSSSSDSDDDDDDVDESEEDIVQL